MTIHLDPALLVLQQLAPTAAHVADVALPTPDLPALQ